MEGGRVEGGGEGVVRRVVVGVAARAVGPRGRDGQAAAAAGTGQVHVQVQGGRDVDGGAGPAEGERCDRLHEQCAVCVDVARWRLKLCAPNKIRGLAFLFFILFLLQCV